MNASDERRPAILDVRPAEQFERLHRVGAANIPLEVLAQRIHELPPRDVALIVYDENPTRARWARSRLTARGRLVTQAVWGVPWLSDGPTRSGPSQARLWRPHRLLIESLEIARRTWPSFSGRKALDLACGSGRDAVHLALEGFKVDAWDILPDALEKCVDLARRNDVIVHVQRRDVEADAWIEPDAYDLICCFNFLHRSLMESISQAVRLGGLVVYETFVHPQRDLFSKPTREAHLLKPDELPRFFDGFETLITREGLAGPRRFAASLVARKRVATGRT